MYHIGCWEFHSIYSAHWRRALHRKLCRIYSRRHLYQTIRNDGQGQAVNWWDRDSNVFQSSPCDHRGCCRCWSVVCSARMNSIESDRPSSMRKTSGASGLPSAWILTVDSLHDQKMHWLRQWRPYFHVPLAEHCFRFQKSHHFIHLKRSKTEEKKNSPSNFLYHFEELRFTLAAPALFVFLLEQSLVTQGRNWPEKDSKIVQALPDLQNAKAQSKYTTDITNPLDALLEQTSDLSLTNRMHQFACRMMRWHQFHTIDESIQFLTEKHDIPTLPNRSLRLQPQRRQYEFIEPMLEYQYDDTHQHTHSEQKKNTSNRFDTFEWKSENWFNSMLRACVRTLRLFT